MRVHFYFVGDFMNNKFMRIAIKEAEKAKKIGEIPVGAVIVKDGKVIGLGEVVVIDGNYGVKVKKVLDN